MTLENAKKVADLVGKIEKKESLITYYENSKFGLADCYTNTIKKMREVVVGRLKAEKQKLVAELEAIQ